MFTFVFTLVGCTRSDVEILKKNTAEVREKLWLGEVDNISVTDDGMCISFKCTSETSANDIKDRLLDGERIKNVNVTKDIISIDI